MISPNCDIDTTSRCQQFKRTIVVCNAQFKDVTKNAQQWS